MILKFETNDANKFITRNYINDNLRIVIWNPG